MIDDARRQAAYDKAFLPVNKFENTELLKPHVRLYVFYARYSSYEAIRDLFEGTLSDSERNALLTFARDELPIVERQIAEKTEKKVRSLVCDRLKELSDLDIAARMDQITRESDETFLTAYSQPIRALSKRARQAVEQYIESEVKPATTHATWTALALADIGVFREDIASNCMEPTPPVLQQEVAADDANKQQPDEDGPQPGRLRSTRDSK